jgi:uncharacterized membrane protein (DUF485 family)
MLKTEAKAGYLQVQRTESFARLRSRSRRYVAAMTVLFLGAFLVTVLLAGWAPSALAFSVAGKLNVGMLFAIGLIVLPAAVSVVHLRYARRRLDPLAERIRVEFERRRQ